MKITILIPCYNEEKTIKKCVESCLLQTRMPDEIIVVDDGSTDKTAEILKSFGRKIRVIKTPKNTGNKSGAQEFGLRYVKGDIFVMTDADTILHCNFVRRMEAKFANKNVAAVAGYVKSLKENWLTACREIDYVVTQEIHKKAQSHIDAIYVIPGCSCAFRTDVFREHITFDHDTITEDLDFTYKLHELGFRISFEPKAIVYTQDPTTLRSYSKQMTRWYSGGWQNLMKHRNVLFKKSSTALEVSISYAEGLALSVCLILLPLLSPYYLLGFISFYLAVALILSSYAAHITKRHELVSYFPLYTGVVVLNALLMFKTFFNEVVLRKKDRRWFKPERRDISCNP